METQLLIEKLAQGQNGKRSINQLIEPLLQIPALVSTYLPLEGAGETHSIPRFIFEGPNSSDPIRIGIFAAIHGDEPASAAAVVQFLINLTQNPLAAENYHIYAYPVCNPTGFEDNTRHSRSGKDLNREFWKSSREPEVQLIENELRTCHFNGLIQLHADDTSDGIYGFVRGATLTENLLRPALEQAGKILPRNVSAQIDGFAARDGIIYDQYDGILAAPAEVEPVPFEIVFETPHLAPVDQQVRALVVALDTILSEYRQLISFAQHL